MAAVWEFLSGLFSGVDIALPLTIALSVTGLHFSKRSTPTFSVKLAWHLGLLMLTISAYQTYVAGRQLAQDKARD
jgi:VanZ family protein